MKIKIEVRGIRQAGKTTLIDHMIGAVIRLHGDLRVTRSITGTSEIAEFEVISEREERGRDIIEAYKSMSKEEFEAEYIYI
jgi:predicted AAA+ superfamily ATPase